MAPWPARPWLDGDRPPSDWGQLLAEARTESQRLQDAKLADQIELAIAAVQGRGRHDPGFICTIDSLMQLVADTNIFLAVALDEPERPAIVRLTHGAELAAPELLPYEIGNALSAMYKRRQLSADQAMAVQTVTERISVRLLEVDVAQALQIALSHRIYAYDAYFLHCARSLACPLLTLDSSMRRVAHSLGIKTLDLSH